MQRGRDMCMQLTVLKKIRDKGRVNGYDVELAEAQAQDYMSLSKKVNSISKKMNVSEKRQIEYGKVLSRVEGQTELIVNRLNSPIEDERKDAIFWQQIKSVVKTPTGKVLLLLMLGCVALAGQRVLELLGLIK